MPFGDVDEGASRGRDGLTIFYLEGHLALEDEE